MSRSLNRVELIGHLGKDAEVKFTPNGVQVAQLTLATSRRWKDKKTEEWKEETDWHRCVYWRVENLAPHLVKGKQVYLAGRLQTREYSDKDGVKRYITEIVCEDLILLGGTGDRTAQPARASAAPAGPSSADADSQGITDDDIPF